MVNWETLFQKYRTRPVGIFYQKKHTRTEHVELVVIVGILYEWTRYRHCSTSILSSARLYCDEDQADSYGCSQAR